MKQPNNKRYLTFIFLLFFAVAGTTHANAQSIVPGCDTCNGPWTATVTSTFAFSMPSHPGCIYKAYVTYRTRPCLGKVQYEIVSHVFEDLNPPGSGCDLHCIDTRELDKILNNHVLNLITGGGGASVIKITPSPCYYTGTIIVPPAAEICFGMTPGSTKVIMVPCDRFGCCFSELTPTGATYYQNVIQSTPCPTTPVIPPSTTIEWSCDLLGGGFATFTVAFMPDMPLVCNTICYTGYAKKSATGLKQEPGIGEIGGFNIYPSPFTDVLNVHFETAVVGNKVLIELFDVTGKLVFSKQELTNGSKQDIVINASTLPAGVYTCRLISGDEKIVTKITK